MLEQQDSLEVSGPGRTSARVPLRKARVQIGRSSDSDIQLAGAYVSRRHARLERPRGQGWRIIDLGSANGTFVNGRRTDVAALSSGDVVSIGSHRLILHVADEESTLSGQAAAQRELVPADARSVVSDRADLSPDRLVPARLLTDLHQASRRLSRAPDIPALLSVVASEFLALLGARRTAVGREDGPACAWPVVVDQDGRAADASDLSERLVPRVQALEGSIAVKLDELMRQERDTEVGGPQTLLFPIKAGERRLGHVYVELDPRGPGTSDETVQFLSLLARQAALIWENLELHTARATADELHQEMSAARQIQLRLFPNRHDLDPALQVAAQNIPALTVSGDYYDFQLLEPGRVLFILADVMGHGLPSALVMASVQAVFRTGVRAGWPLAELDQHIHHVVAASGDGETFVVGLLGLCDLQDHRLTLLSAGHPWPSICCGDSAIERDESAYTFPWGLPVSRETTPATYPLEPRVWSVVAFTDGLADSLRASGEPYGAERVIALHHQHRQRRADELCEEILSDVLRASDDSTPQEDDITLLVLRGRARR